MPMMLDANAGYLLDLAMAQTAMQFVLGNLMNVFAIASMTRAERIFENVQAAGIRLGQEEWEMLNR